MYVFTLQELKLKAYATKVNLHYVYVCKNKYFCTIIVGARFAHPPRDSDWSYNVYIYYVAILPGNV